MFDFIDVCLSNYSWLCIVFLCLGLYMLVKGAKGLVSGASNVARRFGVSDMVIGLTIVAMGTSMPELVVSLASVSEGSTELAITNVLGSNILNIFLILGVTALVYPIASTHENRLVDIPLAVVAGVLLLACDFFGEGVPQWAGFVLLSCFVAFMIYTLYTGKKGKQDTSNEGDAQTLSIGKSILYILLGLIGLIVGGECIVRSAVFIAEKAGVSEAIIGVTIVALGTSLPELVTSVVAATQKNSDIALGNVLGSNIFNVFMILGCTASIAPLPEYYGMEIDAAVAAFAGFLVWLFVKTNKEKQIKRWHGAIFLLLCALYIAFRLCQELHVFN